MELIAADEFLERSRSPYGLHPDADLPVLAVRGGGEPATGPDGRRAQLTERLEGVPMVFVGVGVGAVADALDVVVADTDELARLESAIVDRPIAAVTLAVLLRGSDGRSPRDGLVMESATYSALQAGPEHRSWLDRRPVPRASNDEEASAVQVERDAAGLTITLDRPHVHNAFSARMRAELLDALAVAAADPLVPVTLRGAGPSFCSGGDLTEFGMAADPATAHLIRLGANVGRSLLSMASRLTVEVHGPCVGAGVELPAFAGRVVAHPDATFRLPEVAMGLIPGAGGTVSVVRRIGRQRTARFALTGETIDATEAVRWGLVDELGQP
jgi:Enoyl-CoA hydratase/isomerase